MTTKTIFVTEGAKEYTGGTVTETTGKNITTDVITLALGGSDIPPTSNWTAPDSDTSPTTSSRLVKKLIDNTTDLGTYWLWVKISDNPEVIPMILQGPIVVR